MKRVLLSLVCAISLLGFAGAASAQGFGISIGNGYYGGGPAYYSPPAYNYGYSNYGYSPRVYSGYRGGYAAPAYGYGYAAPAYGYGYAPAVRYNTGYAPYYRRW